MLARILNDHAQDFNRFHPFGARGDGVRRDTPRQERGADRAIQLVTPAHGLFLRAGIDTWSSLLQRPLPRPAVR